MISVWGASGESCVKITFLGPNVANAATLELKRLCSINFLQYLFVYRHIFMSPTGANTSLFMFH